MDNEQQVFDGVDNEQRGSGRFKFSLERILPSRQRTRQNLLVVVLIAASLVGFVVVYRTFFPATPNIPTIDPPGAISGRIISSSEAADLVVKKLESDIKNMQTELKNSFYTKLRNLKPSGEVVVKPGRENPFTP